ncbi:hypothetical protein C3U77_004755 [Escherichia coli]|nr:hypothetical protein [Escherichia coli]EFA7762434.1 hypothetical protein [Escherichia coli]EFA7785823.1 hypothetical protein [Escherichia coli]EFA7793090.1 hypothetical protein [Escherichia coli]EFA7798061.1 hypothetical protein [Escherichia coli]
MSPFLRGSIGPVQNDKGEEPPSNLARHVAKIDHRVSVSFLRKMRSFLRTFSGGLSPCKPCHYWIYAAGQHDRFCE